MSLKMTPKTQADREKLARGLQVLAAEDPHLDVRPGAEADRTVIGGTSEAHLEEIIDRLKREFGVEANVSRPTVVYVETLARPAEGSAKHVTMSHGPGEYGHVSLRVYPAERGSGYTFEDSTVDGTIPKRFMASIDSGIRESMAKGVLNAYPIVDLRVEVDGGSYHDTDSTDAAFRSAAAMAFREAAKRAQPLVLEPVVQVVVRLEDTHITPFSRTSWTGRPRFKRGRTNPARKSSPHVCRSRIYLGSNASFEHRRTGTRPALCGSRITNQWCRARATTMTTPLVLACHAGQCQTFAVIRHRFLNRATAIWKADHRRQPFDECCLATL